MRTGHGGHHSSHSAAWWARRLLALMAVAALLWMAYHWQHVPSAATGAGGRVGGRVGVGVGVSPAGAAGGATVSVSRAAVNETRFALRQATASLRDANERVTLLQRQLLNARVELERLRDTCRVERMCPKCPQCPDCPAPLPPATPAVAPATGATGAAPPAASAVPVPQPEPTRAPAPCAPTAVDVKPPDPEAVPAGLMERDVTAILVVLDAAHRRSATHAIRSVHRVAPTARVLLVAAAAAHIDSAWLTPEPAARPAATPPPTAAAPATVSVAAAHAQWLDVLILPNSTQQPFTIGRAWNAAIARASTPLFVLIDCDTRFASLMASEKLVERGIRGQLPAQSYEADMIAATQASTQLSRLITGLRLSRAALATGSVRHEPSGVSEMPCHRAALHAWVLEHRYGYDFPAFNEHEAAAGPCVRCARIALPAMGLRARFAGRTDGKPLAADEPPIRFDESLPAGALTDLFLRGQARANFTLTQVLSPDLNASAPRLLPPLRFAACPATYFFRSERLAPLDGADADAAAAVEPRYGPFDFVDSALQPDRGPFTPYAEPDFNRATPTPLPPQPDPQPDPPATAAPAAPASPPNVTATADPTTRSLLQTTSAPVEPVAPAPAPATIAAPVPAPSNAPAAAGAAPATGSKPKRLKAREWRAKAYLQREEADRQALRALVPLGKKHGLDQLVLSNGRRYWLCYDDFTVNMSPPAWVEAGMFAPACIRRAYAQFANHMFAVLNRVTRDTNGAFRWSMSAGTVLGAIKFGHWMPYDGDIDLWVYSPDMATFVDRALPALRAEGFEVQHYMTQSANTLPVKIGFGLDTLPGLGINVLISLDVVANGDAVPYPMPAAGLSRMWLHGQYILVPFDPHAYVQQLFGGDYMMHYIRGGGIMRCFDAVAPHYVARDYGMAYPPVPREEFRPTRSLDVLHGGCLPDMRGLGGGSSDLRHRGGTDGSGVPWHVGVDWHFDAAVDVTHAGRHARREYLGYAPFESAMPY